MRLLPACSRLLVPTVGVVLVASLGGCKPKLQRYETKVEVMQIRQFGKDARLTDLELRFVDCPGNVRKVMRATKEFAECGAKLKVGDQLPATVEYAYGAAKDQYRDDVVKLGDCAVTTDPKDESNYELVENCSPLEASGVVVGVHCDRTRSKELAKACPFLYRK